MSLLLALAISSSLPEPAPPPFQFVYLEDVPVDPRPVETPLGRVRVKALRLFRFEAAGPQRLGRIDTRLRWD